MKTPITLDDRLEISADVVSRELDGETVILDLDSGMYFGLEGVGSTIWNAVHAAASLREVVDQVVLEYDVERDTAAADLLSLAAELVDKGIVRVATGARAPRP